MSTLNEYLAQKRVAFQTLKKRASAPDSGPRPLTARVVAEGRSGVRRIRIRDFQILSDSGPDFAGYDLGPSSPEIQLGVLGSCVTHVTLIQAADRGVPLDQLSVEVFGEIDPRAGKPGFAHIPVYPQNLRYALTIVSSAPAEEIAALHEAVERVCPILNLLKHPQEIRATVNHARPQDAVTAAGSAA
jgi:uncharacterized OsmC-like protein